MNTVEHDVMIALLNSLLAKEIITQDIFDKSVQTVLDTTTCPTYSMKKTTARITNPLQGTPCSGFFIL